MSQHRVKRSLPPLDRLVEMAAAEMSAKPIVWMPTRLHPQAMTLAHSLFDVIQPSDARSSQWPELASAAIVRTGKISLEEINRVDPERFKIITRNGVGYEMVPWERCRELGITVTNQPGSNARAVSEIVLGLAINTLRRMVELDRRLRRGEFLPNIDWMAETVDDKVVGLVGMGDIARETAKKFWGAYESPILVYSPTSPAERWTDKDPSGLPPIPHRRVSSLEELLREADIVSLHCPLFDHTRNMISTAQLEMMKPTAVLINTARGGLIDEPALLAALKARTIYGAGLDVLCTEPATKEIYQDLYDQENVVVLPHAGAGTEKVQIESCEVAVMTAWTYLRGEGLGKSKRVV